MIPSEEIEQIEIADRRLEEFSKNGRSAAEYVIAVRAARQACQEAGLDATFDDNGEPSFTRFQTSKAVRHAREDVSATLTLQLFILKRLDRIEKFGWAIIALLIFILFRFSGVW